MKIFQIEASWFAAKLSFPPDGVTSQREPSCIGGVAIVVVGISVIVGILILRRFARSRRRSVSVLPMADARLIEAIGIGASAFEHNAIAYYVRNEALRRHFSSDVVRTVEERYGLVRACPTIDPRKICADFTDDRSLVERALAEWLELQGFPFDPDAPLGAALGDPLLGRAKARASQIIDEIE